MFDNVFITWLVFYYSMLLIYDSYACELFYVTMLNYYKYDLRYCSAMHDLFYNVII